MALSALARFERNEIAQPSGFVSGSTSGSGAPGLFPGNGRGPSSPSSSMCPSCHPPFVFQVRSGAHGRRGVGVSPCTAACGVVGDPISSDFQSGEASLNPRAVLARLDSPPLVRMSPGMRFAILSVPISCMMSGTLCSRLRFACSGTATNGLRFPAYAGRSRLRSGGRGNAWLSFASDRGSVRGRGGGRSSSMENRDFPPSDADACASTIRAGSQVRRPGRAGRASVPLSRVSCLARAPSRSWSHGQVVIRFIDRRRMLERARIQHMVKITMKPTPMRTPNTMPP
ncbi:hypothetical protein GSI_11444 [Ganoderma sinense ZZ0214-1]|uniref:Uncharacterized protein n=1 Tax=Ganoderma sinense ZZ0214-1 TaxID=1077348 RepID=A0A2G8RW33_9APHY|nr:hypothetical protein GSI_11444 [Ganoderma sinense ZZ0214-1]